MSQSSLNSVKIKSIPNQPTNRSDKSRSSEDPNTQDRHGPSSSDKHTRFERSDFLTRGLEGSSKISSSTIKNEKCADSGETIPVRTNARMLSVDKYFNMFGAGGGRSNK